MNIPRFDYKILEDGEIEILIGGRDIKNANGKFVDQFTQKSFQINSTEILKFNKLLTTIAFEWCRKFKCKLGEVECH